MQEVRVKNGNSSKKKTIKDMNISLHDTFDNSIRISLQNTFDNSMRSGVSGILNKNVQSNDFNDSIKNETSLTKVKSTFESNDVDYDVNRNACTTGGSPHIRDDGSSTHRMNISRNNTYNSRNDNNNNNSNNDCNNNNNNNDNYNSNNINNNNSSNINNDDSKSNNNN